MIQWSVLGAQQHCEISFKWQQSVIIDWIDWQTYKILRKDVWLQLQQLLGRHWQILKMNNVWLTVISSSECWTLVTPLISTWPLKSVCFTKRLHWWIQFSSNWQFVCKINVMLPDGNWICRPLKLHRKGYVKTWTDTTNSADLKGSVIDWDCDAETRIDTPVIKIWCSSLKPNV